MILAIRANGGAMSTIELRRALVDTWRTNNRVTVYLFENLPAELWSQKVPGAPRRTVRMIAGHIHNCRCMWVKMLGRRHGIEAPPAVDRHRVARRQLLPALELSSQGITQLLELGVDQGGKLSGFPPRRRALHGIPRGPRRSPPRTDRHARPSARAPVAR
jgi:hypothetical protein